MEQKSVEQNHAAFMMYKYILNDPEYFVTRILAYF